MIKLENKPRFSLFFSLLLLLLTYGAEGWLYGTWMNRLVTTEDILLRYAVATRVSILYGGAVVGIMLLVIIFTSPVSLVTVGLDNWLKSDTRAFLSIFIGAFAFAIVVQRVDYFARFLVLIAAVFLGKLDLQLLGCNRWLCSLILVILCWFGFTGGILAFYRWNF
ncbi:MAG: hypothetical protein AAFQ41_02570 [Cyanobacteria bacterium J06623_7]